MLRNKAKLEIVSRTREHSFMAITLDVYKQVYDEEIVEELESHGPATGSLHSSGPCDTRKSSRHSSSPGGPGSSEQDEPSVSTSRLDIPTIRLNCQGGLGIEKQELGGTFTWRNKLRLQVQDIELRNGGSGD